MLPEWKVFEPKTGFKKKKSYDSILRQVGFFSLEHFKSRQSIEIGCILLKMKPNNKQKNKQKLTNKYFIVEKVSLESSQPTPLYCNCLAHIFSARCEIHQTEDIPPPLFKIRVLIFHTYNEKYIN